MDIAFLYQGQRFVWDIDKASTNLVKHGISFEEACQVFFDPLLRVEDASTGGEQRDAVIGFDGELGTSLRRSHVARRRCNTHHLRPTRHYTGKESV
jgi:uncharacterized DUF497 family protein